MHSATRIQILVGLACLGLACASSTVYAEQSAHVVALGKHAEGLNKVARKAGIRLQMEHLVTGSANGITLAAAPIAGIEGIGASSAPAGVDMGFVYLRCGSRDGSCRTMLPGSTTGPVVIPEGYYTMRFSATVETVEAAYQAYLDSLNGLPPGDTVDWPATMQLVDTRGRVVGTFPAELQEVSSYPGPADCGTAAECRAGNYLDESIVIDRVPGGGNPATITISIWYECKNGQRWCIHIPIGLD